VDAEKTHKSGACSIRLEDI